MQRRPSGELQVSRVVRDMFSLTFKNFGPLIGMSALVFAPLIAYGFAVILGGIDVSTDAAIARTNGNLETFESVSNPLGNFLGLILTGSIVFAVFESVRGRQIPFGRCMHIGVRNLWTLFLIGLCLVGVLLLLLIPVVLGAMAGKLGLFLVLIPVVIIGLRIYVRWWLAPAVAVVERLGAVGSIKRSVELTEAHWKRILGLIVILFVCAVGLGFVIGLVLAVLSSDGAPTRGELALGVLVDLALTLVLGVFGAVAMTLAYLQIRGVTDDADIDELAAVFA